MTYLRRRIAAVRAKHAVVSAGTGLSMAVACCAGVLLVSVLLDWQFQLPQQWRAGLLLLNGAVALYCLVRYALLPLLRRLDDDAIALAVERIAPGFRSRLIAAVQFSRPGGVSPGESPAIVSAMLKQTEQVAANIDFLAVVPTQRFARWGGMAAGVLIIGTCLYAFGGTISPILLRRAFLEPVALPVDTQVEVLSGNMKLATGDRADISARAIGVQPETGTAEIRYASGRTVTLPMTRDKDRPETYAAAIEATPESFTYRVLLNDGTSETFSASVADRPAVQSLVTTQIFPAYTGMGEVRRQPTDLLLLAGSRLRVSVRPNKPLATQESDANVVRIRSQKDTPEIPNVPLTPDAANPGMWMAELPLPENVAGFSIHLKDAEGLESKNPAFYPVDLVRDRAPAVRITSPDRREILATTEATTPVGFAAEDDFGIAAIALHYRIDEQSEQTIQLAIEKGSRQVRGYYPFQISKLPPPPNRASLEGSVIEFWIEARDANDVTGTGITSSERYQVRVVSKSDKQAELIARMAESFSTIHDVSNSQESAAAELGALITAQPP